MRNIEVDELFENMYKYILITL